MGRTFLPAEREAQTRFKLESGYFSEQALGDGIYRGKPRSFCVPRHMSRENLYPPIREQAVAFFSNHRIKWHDAIDRNPSNHLCDSQVACVNFLFPLANKPEALRLLLHPIVPQLAEVLSIEDDSLMTFEWIGLENYLGEKVPRGGHRSRGANCTSADGAVKFLDSEGEIEILLIEWKYTEAYPPSSLRYARSGTDRLGIYLRLLQEEDCPFDPDRLPSLDALFFEPFYQLMRQQLLAHEMERARELNARRVRVLHISPAHNKDLERVTSEELRGLGGNPTDIWRKLQRRSDTFVAVDTEAFFKPLEGSTIPGVPEWWDYVSKRYTWLTETGPR